MSFQVIWGDVVIILDQMELLDKIGFLFELVFICQKEN